MRNRLTSLALVGALAASSAAFAGWDEGVAAFKAKNYAQAAREFEGVVQQRPDWSGGYLMLGRSQLLLDRTSEAVNTLRRGYDLNPSDAQVQLYLAQAYLTGGRAAEAAQLLGTLNAAGLPREQQGFFQQLQAKALADSGQADRAASALARAVAANPNDADLQYQYGALALNTNDVAAAVSALDKAVRLAPNDAAKVKLLVQALIRQGREAGGASNDAIYARAAEAGRKLVALDGKFDHVLLLGEAQLGAKQYDAAIASFNQAASKSPADWLPHFYAGQAQTAVGRYGEAEGALKRALSEAGSADAKSRIWRQLGFVYEKQKNFVQAKSAYQNGGDTAAVTRIEQNEEIAAHNKQAEAEAEKLRQIQAEQDRIRKEIQQEGAPPPRP